VEGVLLMVEQVLLIVEVVVLIVEQVLLMTEGVLLMVERVLLMVEGVLLMVEQETYIGVGFVMFWGTFHSSFIKKIQFKEPKIETEPMKIKIENETYSPACRENPNINSLKKSRIDIIFRTGCNVFYRTTSYKYAG
jgi:hypothetical protein